MGGVAVSAFLYMSAPARVCLPASHSNSDSTPHVGPASPTLGSHSLFLLLSFSLRVVSTRAQEHKLCDQLVLLFGRVQCDVLQPGAQIVWFEATDLFACTIF